MMHGRQLLDQLGDQPRCIFGQLPSPIANLVGAAPSASNLERNSEIEWRGVSLHELLNNVVTLAGPELAPRGLLQCYQDGMTVRSFERLNLQKSISWQPPPQP